MRTIRLALLALVASMTFTACSSPTSYDDCPEDQSGCEFGHPGTGS